MRCLSRDSSQKHPGMALDMKQNVALDSSNGALPGADTVVAHTQRAAHPIPRQAGSGCSIALLKPLLQLDISGVEL